MLSQTKISSKLLRFGRSLIVLAIISAWFIRCETVSGKSERGIAKDLQDDVSAFRSTFSKASAKITRSELFGSQVTKYMICLQRNPFGDTTSSIWHRGLLSADQVCFKSTLKEKYKHTF